MSRRAVLSQVLTLSAGLALGLIVSGPWSRRVGAGAGDRPGDPAVAAGAVSMQANPTTKVVFRQDALYYLDYKAGRILATVPDLRQSVAGTHVLKPFAARDLVADFRLPPGVTPQFRMTVGELGVGGGGWSPLYVFEATTRQVAVYRAQSPVLGPGSDGRPPFDLLEIRELP